MAPTKKAAATRTRLLDAAATVLAHGDGDFEMADLATTAGVSGGLAYHHFGSKAGVIAAVVDDFYTRWIAATNQRFQGEEGWTAQERRRELASIAFLFDDPLAPIVLEKRTHSAEVAAIEADHRRAMIAATQQRIEAGQVGGEVALALDAATAASVTFGAVTQSTLAAITSRGRPDVQQFADQLWTVLSSGLLGDRAAVG